MSRMLQLKYERNLNHTYLVYEGNFRENDYAVQMLLNNSIEGLLRCHLDKVDGRERLYYEISSRQPLTSIFEKKKIDYRTLRILLECFKDILGKLEEYLLPEEYLMTGAECIFMEPEQERFHFCIIPSSEAYMGIQPLMEFLLEHIDYTDEKAVAAAYEWYKRAGEENCSFTDIYRQVFLERDHNYDFEQTEKKNKISMSAGETVSAAEGIYEAEPFTEVPKEEVEKRHDEKIGNKKSMISGKKTAVVGVAAVVVILMLAGCTIYFGIERVAAAAVIVSVIGFVLYRRIKEQNEEYVWEADEAGIELEKVPVPDNLEIKAQEVNDYRETAESGQEYGEKPEIEKEYGETVFITNACMEKGRFLKPVGSGFPLLGIKIFPYIIGKLAGAVDGVIEHETVSRIHCKLELEDGNYYICDLNSTNGTIVNGTVVDTEERMELRPGDEIQIGQALYVFE